MTVKDTKGNSTTCPFVLTISGCVASCTNPAITTQPNTTQTLCLDKNPANISVVATGTSLTYQWYSNTTNNNTSGSQIAGATNDSYTPPTNLAGTTYYYVIITSGTCTTTSNNFTSI